MPNIYKLSNAGGFKTLTRYPDMLAGNTVWSPWTPEGSVYEVAKYTVPTGGVTSVTLAVPTGYRHLELHTNTYNTSSQGNFQIYFNGDSSANYLYQYIRGSGSGAPVADYGTSMTYGYINYDNNTGGTYCARIISIPDYASTKNKNVKTIGGWDANGSGITFLQSNAWMSSSAITSITLQYNAGNFAANSSFTLIGVK